MAAQPALATTKLKISGSDFLPSVQRQFRLYSTPSIPFLASYIRTVPSEVNTVSSQGSQLWKLSKKYRWCEDAAVLVGLHLGESNTLSLWRRIRLHYDQAKLCSGYICERVPQALSFVCSIVRLGLSLVTIFSLRLIFFADAAA